jgi:tetratricopeptide (TPR) repeat protein
MTDEAAGPAFPRESFERLLGNVADRFDSKESRALLLSDLGIGADAAAEPAAAVSSAESGSANGAERRAARWIADLSGARFIAALVDTLSDPSRLDAAMTLARRVSAQLGSTYDAAPLLTQLDRLFMRHRAQAIDSVPSSAASRREWRGFDCIHYYSLTDRFFGRAAQLADLDAWLTPAGGETAVRCLTALGGGGKSALAWHWLNRALPSMQQSGYCGALWCSFYEKDFEFPDFLRRALAFASGLPAGDVAQLSRSEVERRLLEFVKNEPFVFVLDGLERLMNGYAVLFDRAIDPDSIPHAKHVDELTAHDRRLTDPRSGAFLQALSDALASKFLITTRLRPADLEDTTTGRPRAYAQIIDLKGLDAKDATDLWKSINPAGEVPRELEAVFALSKYHPLVISILARSVAGSAGGSWEAWRSLEQHRDFDPAAASTDAAIRSHIIGICVRDLDERAYDVLGVLTTSGKPMPLDLLSRVLIDGSAAGGDERWTANRQVEEEVDRLVSLGFVGVAERDAAKEFDVHPVVRGAAWNLITDPQRERFLSHALSEFFATPDRQQEGVDLNKATSLFQLLVQSREMDRAWDMYLNKLWWPLTLKSDYRTLLDLFELMLPQREPLQLLPLASRREQGNAAQVLGALLMSAGDSAVADTLLRWCGAIRLQLGDFIGVLDARHHRSWATMYEGRLFETELDLRQTRADAQHFQALDIVPFIDCWIGIVLALRGEEAPARRQFDQARGKTPSYRWWAQGLAEGYIYLNAPDQALECLDLARRTPLHPTEGRLQEAWEQLTRGIARFQKESFDEALDDLSKALEVSLRANYSVIRCFALPCVAEIFLRRGQIDAAEAHVNEYFRVDPESRYRLAAADAWRVRARCCLARGHCDQAIENAAKAYRLAACDGPPFVYREGLRRALETLRECGAYVPRTEAALDPNWRAALSAFEERLANGAADAAMEHDGGAPPTMDEARRLLRQSALMREASEQDRRWWSEITRGAPAGIDIPLAKAMQSGGITLEGFRSAYEQSEYKSVLVVFYTLFADSIVPRKDLRLAGALDDAAKVAWLQNAAEHQRALDHFLTTDFAQRVAHSFEVHDLDKVGFAAFLDDDKRRIGYQTSVAGTIWWDQLEQQRPTPELLRLAEGLALEGTTLDEFVDTIAVGTPRGIEYAFAALRLRRAIDELKVDTISTTEGWTDVQVFLRLEDVKRRLGWRDATAPARDVWTALEQKHRERLAPVLRIAEELAIRAASVDDYYSAYLRANTEDVDAILAFVDYFRLKDQPWNGAPRRGQRPASPAEAPRAFAETSTWADGRVRKRLELLETRVGVGAAAATARAWWAAIEQQQPARAMLRLAEELDERQASLMQLHQAHIDGATDNVAAAFAYLDFGRIKRNNERQASERANARNTEGNTHYRAARYREATESYEAAIREQPGNAIFYANLAAAWERVVDVAQTVTLDHAIAALERGVQKAGESDALRTALASVRRKKRLVERDAFTEAAKSASMLSLVTPLAVEVAADLIPLVEGDDGLVFAAMPAMRDRIRAATGIAVPAVRFRGNATDLPDGTYILMFDEVPVANGTVRSDRVFTTVPRDELTRAGIAFEPSVDPADGSAGFWIAAGDMARLNGASLDPAAVIVRHLETLIRRHLPLFINYDIIVDRLDTEWRERRSEIADDGRLLVRFARVLKALADERVPLLAFASICESFVATARGGASVDETLAAVRALPDVVRDLPGRSDGALVELSADIEATIRSGLRRHGDESLLALLPERTQELLTAVRDVVRERPAAPPRATRFVLLTADTLVRRYVRKLVEVEFPDLMVLAASERDPADARPITARAS